MSKHLRRCLLPVILFALISGFSPALGKPEPIRELTILYTNDFHSAFDPIPAYWLPGSPKLGGAAQLGTLINQIRTRDKTVFQHASIAHPIPGRLVPVTIQKRAVGVSGSER